MWCVVVPRAIVPPRTGADARRRAASAPLAVTPFSTTPLLESVFIGWVAETATQLPPLHFSAARDARIANATAPPPLHTPASPVQPTARAPMGSNKRDHISAIIHAPHVAEAWKAAHGGAASTEADIDALYAAFTPIQVEVVKTRAKAIPGAVALLERLRAAGVRVGGCSGYNDAIMASVAEAAAALPVEQGGGVKVEASACANAAGNNGRPKPWMAVEVALALDAWPLRACVKVDDTPVGIGEGLNAGE